MHEVRAAHLIRSCSRRDQVDVSRLSAGKLHAAIADPAAVFGGDGRRGEERRRHEVVSAMRPVREVEHLGPPMVKRDDRRLDFEARQDDLDALDRIRASNLGHGDTWHKQAGANCDYSEC